MCGIAWVGNEIDVCDEIHVIRICVHGRYSGWFMVVEEFRWRSRHSCYAAMLLLSALETRCGKGYAAGLTPLHFGA